MKDQSDAAVVPEFFAIDENCFHVTREDNCIWLHDDREGGLNIHLVPEQAYNIALALLRAAGAGKF